MKCWFRNVVAKAGPDTNTCLSKSLISGKKNAPETARNLFRVGFSAGALVECHLLVRLAVIEASADVDAVAAAVSLLIGTRPEPAGAMPFPSEVLSMAESSTAASRTTQRISERSESWWFSR